MPLVTESLSESLDVDWLIASRDPRASRDPFTFSSDDDEAPSSFARLSANFFFASRDDVTHSIRTRGNVVRGATRAR